MKTLTLLLSTAALGMICHSPAAAQEAPLGEQDVQEQNDAAQQSEDPGVGGEIIVTAQKRAESLQRVPAAVTAVGGEALAELGVFDQSQLSKLVPGVTIGAQGGNGVVFIRGVGQTQGTPNTQPGVSVNTNGVYLPRESGRTPLFDLARIEVLPGPQGTLWGRNSAGGAVNFITQRPVFDFEASGTLEVGNYKYIRPTVMLNVPVGDTFAIRAAGEYNSRAGYLSNGAYDQDVKAGRLSFLFEPSSSFSAFLMGSYSHEGGIGSQSIFYSEDRAVRGQFNPVGNIYQQTFSTAPLNQDRDVWILQGEFNVELSDNMTLTYIPAFVDIVSDDIVQFQGIRPSNFTRKARQYSHELRLSNSARSRLNYVLGAFWYQADHYFRNINGVLLPTPIGRTLFLNDVKSKALFGEATYSITDEFRATVGGRYSIDRFDGTSLATSPPRSEANPLLGAGKNRDSRVDWKVGAQYDIAPRSMLYGTVQTGYLIGGFQQNGDLFPPSVLTAYTAGAKNRFLDGQLTANLEAFYYDYKNYQLQALEGAFFINVSSPARIKGVQLELVATPNSNNTFSASFATQDTDILERRLALRNGVATSIFGFDLPNAPRYTVNLGWNNQIDLANGGSIDTRISSQFNSGYWMVFTQDRHTRQPSFTTTDATLTYNPPGRGWSVGAFVRNLEDTPVFIGANKPAPNALSTPYVNAPRTYGARFEVNF